MAKSSSLQVGQIRKFSSYFYRIVAIEKDVAFVDFLDCNGNITERTVLLPISSLENDLIVTSLMMELL